MIVLRAGHGTGDSGAVGPTGLQEHDIAADVVQRIGHLLRAHQVAVQEFTNNRRSEAMTWLRNHTADLYVEIHCNAATGKAKGTETWWYTGWGKHVAGCVQQNVVEYLRTPGGWYLPAYPDADRGIKEAVAGSRAGNCIRGAACGGLLLEMLFIDNRREEGLLRLPTVRQEIAQAVADGIIRAADTSGGTK